MSKPNQRMGSRSKFRAGVTALAAALVMTAVGCAGTTSDTSSDSAAGVAGVAGDAPFAAHVPVADGGQEDSVDFGTRGMRQAGISDSEQDVSGELPLTLFVAAAEETLVGTSSEGVILSDPMHYVAAGVDQCDSLEAGFGLDDTIAGLAESSAEFESDPALVGAVVGAAVESLCPQHSALFDQ